MNPLQRWALIYNLDVMSRYSRFRERIYVSLLGFLGTYLYKSCIDDNTDIISYTTKDNYLNGTFGFWYAGDDAFIESPSIINGPEYVSGAAMNMIPFLFFSRPSFYMVWVFYSYWVWGSSN